ncbi:hypothetical protein MAC_04683 [Metarhizium acridum CQMa 102]|uniref:Uncharacterized protein n=1 Tax=Metarhizium acridum (strain CQMa 102) TaxID=655827 RepID=E9E485_METAQ|nr:uncharacterized protein MAC_04683 [Metarhizium acridum CQMa 102]EFY89302.1 hypothetical protein MAC_04683 [Metarhizium acridum CQMa 102]
MDIGDDNLDVGDDATDAGHSEMDIIIHDTDASDNKSDCEDNDMDAGNSKMEIDVDHVNASDGKIVSGGKKWVYVPATPDGAMDVFVEDGAEYSYNMGAEETQTLGQHEDMDAIPSAMTNGTATNEKSANNGKRIVNKRKRTASAPAPAKRLKCFGQVNITATRARVQYDGKVCEYTWQRNTVDGRRWVRHPGGEREVYGEYLLVHGPNMSIKVMVKTTWLPITVEWDIEKGVYQGEESIGGRILTVEETATWDAMNVVEGTHVGFIRLLLLFIGLISPVDSHHQH